MEDRSNKTIMCSVLFLDIVEYSKMSVMEQISLKDRFNTYLSGAIHDVPVSDRIILDTGDGAAVNFLGDVESALTAALRLRVSLLHEEAELVPPLLVRIGINLGPVRLVRDINGQPNIVGDGINVAQRVMGFAEASQILVSRSYFDAVSRLSAQYTGMFHYQGSRTDKHVREHEIYAIGYPGDQTTRKLPEVVPEVKGRFQGLLDTVRALGSTVSPAGLSDRLKLADSRRRFWYAGLVVMPLILLAAMLELMPGKPAAEVQALQAVETMPHAVVASEVSVVKPEVEQPKAVVEKVTQEQNSADKKLSDKANTQPPVKRKVDTVKKSPESAKYNEDKKGEPGELKSVSDPENKADPVKESYLMVSCKDGAQLFVDGASKGKITSGALTVPSKPGRHKVILTHASFGIFTQEVTIEPGKTERIRPKECN
jgi:hypothetical protein